MHTQHHKVLIQVTGFLEQKHYYLIILNKIPKLEVQHFNFAFMCKINYNYLFHYVNELTMKPTINSEK